MSVIQITDSEVNMSTFFIVFGIVGLIGVLVFRKSLWVFPPCWIEAEEELYNRMKAKGGVDVN